MRLARWAGILVAVLLAACTSNGSGDRGERTSPVGAPASPTLLPRLVLTAQLSERPGKWNRVASIPFGDGREDLGFVPAGRHTPVPYVPRAFAVANDGSLWFLDPVKHRLAHYTNDGRFLGQVEGIPFDPSHPEPRDVTISGGKPVVLQNGYGEHQGIVLEPGADGSSASVTVHDGLGRDLHVSNLIQTSDRSSSLVVGQVEGPAFRVGEMPTDRPEGAADLGLSTGGRVRFLSGQPLGDGGFVRLRFVDFTDIEAGFIAPSGASLVLPIRLRLEAGNHTISAVASAEFQTALRNGVACLVKISPNSSKDARRYGGGRWFLELEDDGSPLVWERLPNVPLEDEDVVRHLAAGPDGSVYLMQVDRKGVSIYRR